MERITFSNYKRVLYFESTKLRTLANFFIAWKQDPSNVNFTELENNIIVLNVKENTNRLNKDDYFIIGEFDSKNDKALEKALIQQYYLVELLKLSEPIFEEEKRYYTRLVEEIKRNEKNTEDPALCHILKSNFMNFYDYTDLSLFLSYEQFKEKFDLEKIKEYFNCDFVENNQMMCITTKGFTPFKINSLLKNCLTNINQKILNDSLLK